MGNFNSLVFPAPENLQAFEIYTELQLLVPKTVSKEVNLANSIPCFWIRQASDKMIIFFHGNAEDIGSSLDLISEISSQNGMNLIIPEYPGYGSYRGSPNAADILKDAQTVYSHIVNNLGFPESNIVVMGRSIGSGPATHLASANSPSALILFSPYTTLKDVVTGLVGPVLSTFVRNRFKNIEKIDKVKCRVLFIHGKKDTLIPYSHSQQLSAKTIIPAVHVFPAEMTHNDFNLYEDVLQPIHEFLVGLGIVKPIKL